jgi:uncharacterized membrane protein YoaT (DUF817 family)
MSHLEAETSSVWSYLRELRTPFLVTVAAATLLSMVAWWGMAFAAFLIFGPAYAFFAGWLCVQTTPNRHVMRYVLLIMSALATQVIFCIAGFYVVGHVWNETNFGLVGFTLLCAAGPIGTWIGPALLAVVILQARPSSAC